MNGHGPREQINPFHLWMTAGVPLWLLQQDGITEGAKLLYGRLMLYAGKTGRAYPNQVTLGADLGTSSRQIRRWLKELVDQHLIEVKERHYVFLRHHWQEWSINSNFDMAVKRRQPEPTE